MLVRTDTPAFVAPHDRLQQAIYGGAQVDTMIVDGEVVLRDGRTVRVDEAAVLAEAAEYARARHSHAAATVPGELDAAFGRAYRTAIRELGPAWHERMGA